MQRVEDEAIVNRLDTLIQLVAIALTENKTEQKEQIRLLMLAGIPPSRIAGILGTTGNSVNGAIAKMRKSEELRMGR
jgi:DNA-binding CsgD family transcriptional regulator